MVDETWIRGEIECCDLHPSEHSRRMKAALLELLARRDCERCVMAATTAELEDRDSGDEWLAVDKAQAALDSLLGREPFDKAYDRTHEATR